MLGVSTIMAKSLPSSLAQCMMSSLMITSNKCPPFVHIAPFNTGVIAKKPDLQLPKRPTNPFAMFVAEQRSQFVGENRRNGDIMKLLAQKWAELEDEKKGKYHAIFVKGMEEYKQKMADITEDPKNSYQLTEWKTEKLMKKAAKAKRRARAEKKKLVDKLGKPKAPASAYLLFVKDRYPVESKKHTKPGLAGREIAQATVKSIGEQWTELDERTKEPYTIKHASLKEAYNAELKDWQENNPDTESDDVDAARKKLAKLKKRVKIVKATSGSKM